MGFLANQWQTQFLTSVNTVFPVPTYFRSVQHRYNRNIKIKQVDPGGLGARVPPCTQDFFKIMQFSGNFKWETLFWAIFGLRAPLGVKTPLDPPDQNPGSEPAETTNRLVWKKIRFALFDGGHKRGWQSIGPKQEGFLHFLDGRKGTPVSDVPEFCQKSSSFWTLVSIENGRCDKVWAWGSGLGFWRRGSLQINCYGGLSMLLCKEQGHKGYGLDSLL